MKPVFNVGEQVITFETGCPKYDGVEAVIYAVIPKGIRYACRLTGAMCWINDDDPDSFGYLLDIPFKDDDCENGYEVLWRSAALRKKPKAGDMSFGELMQDINSKPKSAGAVKNKSLKMELL